MISLNDVLLAASNIPVDDPIAEIWGRGLQGGYKIIEYTGALPITITANGDALLDYRIYGADGGVGVATENLLDYSKCEKGAITVDGTIGHVRNNSEVSDYIDVSGESYVVIAQNRLYNTALFDQYMAIGCYNENYAFMPNSRSYKHVESTVQSEICTLVKQLPSGAKYVRANFLTNIANESIRSVDAMIILGSDIPTSYIPYGYKLPMTVQSANLFDYTQTDFEKGYRSNQYLTKTGQLGVYGEYQVSEYIEIHPETPYYLSNFFTNRLSYAALCFYDENYQYLSGISYGDNTSLEFVSLPLAKFIRFTYHYNAREHTALFELHKIPVYIGENQLDAGEYVSYGDGKIYRMVDGALTPTDPPVPLPEIPTIDGTTVIDYDGDPKPSQMYVEYKGKK